MNPLEMNPIEANSPEANSLANNAPESSAPEPSAPEPSAPESSARKTVLVCRNKTCSSQGSAKVLSAFEANAPEDVNVKRSGCLGQCGSGPMVLVEPEEIWYSRVQERDVDEIVSRHLVGDRPVKRLLYPVFHPQQSSTKGWWIVGAVLLGLVLMMFGAIVLGQTVAS